MGNIKPKEKTLLWIDLKTKHTEDKSGDQEGKENQAEFKKLPLAKLIPIRDSIDFSKRCVLHHSKT